MLAKYIQKLFVIAAAGGMLSACSSQVDLNKLHEDFQEQPQGYDQLMTAANRARDHGDVEKAKKWYKEAMNTAEATGGVNDYRVANAALGDAGLCKGLGQLGEAEEMYKRAYDVQKNNLPPTSPEFKETRKAYAEILLINYKADEAKKIDPNVKLPTASSSSKRPVRKRH